MLPEPALTIFRLTPFLLFWWLRVTPMKSHSHFLIIRSLYFFFFLRARFDLRIWFLFWPASLVTLCLFSLLSGLAAAALASLTLFLFFVRSFFTVLRFYPLESFPWHMGYGTTHLGHLRFWNVTSGKRDFWNHTFGTVAFLNMTSGTIAAFKIVQPHIWDICVFGTWHLGRGLFWNRTSGTEQFRSLKF